jgi:hypothetical protein
VKVYRRENGRRRSQNIGQKNKRACKKTSDAKVR